MGTATTLLFGAINAMVSVVAFTPILWNLSGPLTVFSLTVGHALFWIALIYVFATTVIAFWIGRPLIRFSFRNELTNAAFRYALVRMRDAAESISFYRGGEAESPFSEHDSQLSSPTTAGSWRAPYSCSVGTRRSTK